MMTVRECRQRCQLNGMGLDYRQNEFRVYFPEVRDHAKREASAYYTDDAEDAALTASAMRNRAKANQGR